MKILMLCAVNPAELDMAAGHLARQSSMVPWLNAETLAVPISSWEKYNKWFIDGFNYPDIDKSGFDFILNIEPDASIANPEAWDDVFFNYDYIGAPWRTRWKPFIEYAARHGKKATECPVGNSGFCLMSRGMVDTLRKLKPELSDYGKDERHEPCDWFLMVAKGENLARAGVRVATIELASKFAVERDVYSGQFGVHNWVSVNGRHISLKDNRYHALKDLAS